MACNLVNYTTKSRDYTITLFGALGAVQKEQSGIVQAGQAVTAFVDDGGIFAVPYWCQIDVKGGKSAVRGNLTAGSSVGAVRISVEAH